MKVALLGPEGTFTHEAVEEYFDNYEPVFCSTIKEVFKADADAAIIPFENSIGGGVGESIDYLHGSNVDITGEQRLKIEHCLVSEEQSIEEIDTIRSHPQALDQCRGIIEKHGWEEIESSSTAKAAQEIGKGEAAIASRTAAEINDLNVLEEDVSDNGSNVTRFMILNGETSEGEKTAMIIEPGEDRPGLLESMLSCFSGHGINLSHIQSRPTKTGLGEYFFYIEAEADQNSEEFQKTLTCLETYANVQVLGSYTSGDPQ